MKKIVLCLLAVIMVISSVFTFVSCSGDSDEETALTKVIVAHHLGYSGSAIVAVGINMGYFEEEGLDVELAPFTSGPSEIAAMVSGNVDFGYIGSGATTLAVKGDVEIIYFQNLGDAEAIIVNKESGIETMADMKGKTIATTLGTSGENIVNMAIAKAGLEIGDGPDQVEVINMDMGGCVTAMVAGRVDAVCVWGSYQITVEGQLADNYHELARTADFAEEYVSVSSWLATQEYIDANPETVQAFANALAKSFDYWKVNEEQVAVWVAEIVEADEDTIKAQIGGTFFLNSAELEDALADGTIRKYYEVQQVAMVKNGQIDNPVPIDEYVKWDYMEKAIENAK